MLGVKLVRPDGTFDHACKRGFPDDLVGALLLPGFRVESGREARASRATSPVSSERTRLAPWTRSTVPSCSSDARAADAVGRWTSAIGCMPEDIDCCHRFWDEGWESPVLAGVQRDATAREAARATFVSWRLNREFHHSMWLFYVKHVAPGNRRLSRAGWLGDVDEVRALRLSQTRCASRRSTTGATEAARARSGVDPRA
jgi:hypothetical protein